MNDPTTPRKISGSIKRFIRTLGTDENPRFLPFTYSSDKYLPLYCLSNCEAENRKTGNQVVFGWVIWELRQKGFIEAEFHAVMKRGNDFVDITPRVDGEAKILFVPDPNRIAKRVDARTWRSWTNQKSRNGHVTHETQPMNRVDTAGNVKSHNNRGERTRWDSGGFL